METLTPSFAPWLIAGLYALCFAGLTHTFLQALRAGAENYASVYTTQTARQFEDIFFFIPPRRILEIAWTAALACFVLLFFLAGDFASPGGMAGGAFAGALGGGLVLALPRRVLAFLKARRLTRFNEQLTDALMTMSNALRSGASILQAFEHIARQNQTPISQEFGLFLQETRVGVKLEEALGNLGRRVGSEDLLLMIGAIEIARQTGGNLTEVFEKIAATIRERIRIQTRIRTLTAQGRMQGIVVGAMPIALALAMFAINPTMMRAFFLSPLGLAICVAVVGLVTLGAFLIRRIMAIDI